jgi:hypothetical protein
MIIIVKPKNYTIDVETGLPSKYLNSIIYN